MDPPPVQYVTTSDGFSIAYCVSGEGRPLFFVSGSFMDIQQVWRYQPEWMEGLAARFRLIQLDPRGFGMSARNLPESLTLQDYVCDLETVVDRVQAQSFLIWGLGGQTFTAVRYAAQHAERVAALILVAPAVTGQAWGPVLYSMLPNEDWESFLRTQIPAGLTREARLSRLQAYQRTLNRDDWNTYRRCMVASTVEQDMKGLPMPALVMHARDSLAIPAEAAMQAAALIPNSRFVSLNAEFTLEAAAQGVEAIDSFVKELLPVQRQGELSASRDAAGAGLSQREIEVLRLIAGGRSNQQIADELVISVNTVNRHISHIFDKIGVANRTEAAVYARDHGIG